MSKDVFKELAERPGLALGIGVFTILGWAIAWMLGVRGTAKEENGSTSLSPKLASKQAFEGEEEYLLPWPL